MKKDVKCMSKQGVLSLKKGDKILCYPAHFWGGNSLRVRTVTEVSERMRGDEYAGIAVRAHGYKDFWLKWSEIFCDE